MEFGDVGYCGGGKTEVPEEKPSEQSKNQQQTKPTYGTKSESNLGHIGGSWQALRPLRHHRAILAPLFQHSLKLLHYRFLLWMHIIKRSLHLFFLPKHH